MKNLTFLLMLTLSLSIIISCKKDPVLSNTTAAGTWDGRYSLGSSTSSTFVRFTILSNGNVTVLDTAGTTTLTGTSSISSDSLITTVTNGAFSVNFRLRAINKISRFDGKWQNLTTLSASGTIFLDKK